jgi:hypothetical protein
MYSPAWSADTLPIRPCGSGEKAAGRPEAGLQQTTVCAIGYQPIITLTGVIQNRRCGRRPCTDRTNETAHFQT